VARIDDAASADLDSLTAFLTARQNVGSAARRVLVRGNGVEAFSRLATHAPITPKVLEEEIGVRDDQRAWFTFPRASYSVRWQFAVRRSVVRSENAPWEEEEETTLQRTGPSGNAS
jgi:hypothetical protein